MSNLKEEQRNDDFQDILNAGENALQDLYKLQEEIKNAGEAQANEAERLIEESDGLVRRMLSWLTVAIVMVSLLASPTKAQDLPQVPPAPTVGEPARIERVYLPLVMVDSANVESLVNWNSKRADGEIGTYGGWQARGN